MDTLIRFLKWLFSVFAGASASSPVPSSRIALPNDVVNRVADLARNSPAEKVSWRERGVAPTGYIVGMAVMFGAVYNRWKSGDPTARIMARAIHETDENDKTDALSWYNSNFRALGMSNDVDGADTLRHNFVLLTGLGMFESNGRYCEGRDRKVDPAKLTSDNAESGLFQMSWDIHGASPVIPKLLDMYYAGLANKYLSVFQEGVYPAPRDLEIFGGGDGAKCQKLCKDAPAFAVEAAAVGLRVAGGNKGHWGPIRRKDVELKREIDILFLRVQELIDGKPVVVPPVAVQSGKPPWYLASEKEIGFHETVDNRGIEKYVAAAKSGTNGDPYCAIGLNWALETTGFHGTRSAMARSFEDHPDFKMLIGPAIGAIMTFWRGSPASGSGHVSQYAGQKSDGSVLGLGWNQSDSVNVAKMDMSRFTGYWWPRTYPAPKIGHVAYTGRSSEHGSEA